MEISRYLYFCLITIELRVITTDKTKIYIGGLVPKIFGFQQNDEFCFKSAITVAVRLINEDTSILNNYELCVEYGDTEANVGRTFERLYSMIYDKKRPKILAIIGPGYSSTAMATAEVCTVKAILQMSYSAMLPSLTKKDIYPFFFRSTQSAESLNKAKINLLKLFKWKYVSLIYDYTNVLHFQATENLSKMLTENNITAISISGFSSKFGEEISPQIEQLQSIDTRVFIGAFGNYGARKVFCEVYKRKLFGPKYVWILMSVLTHDWYIDQLSTNDDDTNCTVAEILTAAEGHLTAMKSSLRTDSNLTASGKTAEEIWKLIKEEKRALNKAINISDDSSMFYEDSVLAYDAVWAVAKVLDEISKPPIQWNLTYFTYNDYHISIVLATLMERLKFQGASGPISFDPITREREGEVIYKHFQNGMYFEVGRTNTASGNICFTNEKIKMIFPHGIPRDKATTHHQVMFYSRSIIIGLWGFAFLGILLAIVFLGFNICYKNVKVIKMSSPNINNIISIGCILCYLSVILYGVDSRFVSPDFIPWICNIFSVFLALGFTLCFGGLFSKTWRVYKIYTATKTLERVMIKDIHLIGVISILIVVDVAIFTTWMLISPFYLETKEFEKTEDFSSDIINVPYMHQCKCSHQLHFIVSLYIYKGLLLLFGLFLAWETRKVSVPALNDSKFIGMAVYNVCVLSAVGAVCSTALYGSTNQDAGYAIVSICICLSTNVTLLLIFVPKVRMLLSKHDHTKSVMQTTHTTIKQNERTRKITNTSGKPKMQYHHSVVNLRSNGERVIRTSPYRLQKHVDYAFDSISTSTVMSENDGKTSVGSTPS